MAASVSLSKTARNRGLIKAIYNIYARPIIEYGAPVWATDRITHYKELDGICHNATRWTLGSSRLPIQPNYIDFPTRCKLLCMDEPIMRRNYLMARMACKVRRRELLCNGNDILNNALNNSTSRHATFYAVHNYPNTIWKYLMEKFNRTNLKDDLTLSWDQQQQRLKLKLLVNTHNHI